jgi:hypothetical protein
MDTVKQSILQALIAGQRLTPLNALIRFHCLSLSQRIGELKREGNPIQSRTVKLDGGKRISEYFMGRNEREF